MNPRGALNARRNSRPPVSMNAKLRMNSGAKCDTAVLDLSAEGCCITSSKLGLRPSQRISIKLESLEYVHGFIKWALDSSAGIEFDRPLYGPVAEHLQRHFLR
jgi:hypothetical protein